MQPCLRLTLFCGNGNVKYCHSSKSRLQRFSFAEQEMQFIQHGAFLEVLATRTLPIHLFRLLVSFREISGLKIKYSETLAIWWILN